MKVQDVTEDEHIIDNVSSKESNFNINDVNSLYFEDWCMHLNEPLNEE